MPTLHGIRGIALLLVVGFHVGGAATWTPNHQFVRAFYEYAGPLALDLLFFTTGFVLFLPVVRNADFGSVRGLPSGASRGSRRPTTSACCWCWRCSLYCRTRPSKARPTAGRTAS